MILVIGLLMLGTGEGDKALRRQGYSIVDFQALDTALLRASRPDMVVSALIGNGFDALDVARRLSQLGYTGPYRAFSPQLPDPDLIRSEVRAAAPELDFDILEVSHGPDRPG